MRADAGRPRSARLVALAGAILAAVTLAAGCGAGAPSRGAPVHSAAVSSLETACARGWKFAASVEEALKLAAERHVTSAGEVPQAIVERIGEPSGEASAAWTTAAESARAAGYPALSRLAARSAADYGEVQFDLSPEGGGYGVTVKSLDQAAHSDSLLGREALARGLKRCANSHRGG